MQSSSIAVKKLFLLSLCCLLTLVNCRAGQSANSQEITVFAAASLTDAFMELADAFEAQNEGVQTKLNFAGSSQLAAQLREGAIADVFAPANPAQMERVIADGRITPNSERLFVSNRLILIVPADNPANINTLEDLAQPNTQLILAIPAVPIRQYTDQAILTLPANLQSQIYDNLVSEEDNVRQVSAKIALGEADAGIVYTSDVTPDLAHQIQQISIPDAQNIIATYPIAPLADSTQPELARAFIDFVLSPDGQNILTRWGFGSINDSEQ